jgi:hypothetical protein
MVSISAWPGSYSLTRDLGAVGSDFVAIGLTDASERECSPLHSAMNTRQGLLIMCGTALV